MIRQFVAFGVENLRGVLFVAGCCCLYIGIAGFSSSAAKVTAGLILMAIGGWPYMLAKRKS